MKTRKAKSVLDAYLIAKKDALTTKNKKYPCDVCKEVATLKDGQCQKCVDATTEPQHTPTPWKVSQTGKFVMHSRPGTVLNVCEASEENAAFIVRAVNSYEEMLQTFKHIQELAEENSHSAQDGYAMIAEWARNQIVKAEGK